MHELPKLYTQEIQISSKSVEKEVLEELPSKEHKYGMRPKKLKLSIDLNRHAYEENYGEYKEETWDALGKQKIEELQATIKESKQEKRALELWNTKLQDKVQTLKGKNKDQQNFLKGRGNEYQVILEQCGA